MRNYSAYTANQYVAHARRASGQLADAAVLASGGRTSWPTLWQCGLGPPPPIDAYFLGEQIGQVLAW